MWLGNCISSSANWCPLKLKHRFVDRDMMMRYHWGIGIGHVYSQPNSGSDADGAFELNNQLNMGEPTIQGDLEEEPENDDPLEQTTTRLLQPMADDPMAGDDPELGLEEREKEDLDGLSDTGSNRGIRDDNDDTDDEAFAAFHEMYY